MTSSKETAKSLDTLRSRCRAVYTIYGLGLVGALVLLFLRELSAALLVFIVLMAMYLFVVQSEINQYSAKWREHCVRAMTERFLGPIDYRYKAKASDVPGLKAHLLLPPGKDSGLLARNTFTAKKAGFAVSWLDATLPVDENGALRFYSGCWMGFMAPCRTEQTVYVSLREVIPNGGYDAYLTGKLNLRRCSAPEGFVRETAFYTASGELNLPEDVLASLHTLLRSIRGTAAIELGPDGLFIFLHHRLLNMLPPSLKYPITEKMVESPTFIEGENAYRLALTMRAR